MWKNININKNQIKVYGEKSVLINCPHNSNYDGYSFWHPAKCVRNGRNSSSISIGYTDEFKFRLIKYGKGQYNSREIIEEQEITVEEFEEMYQVENSNISQKVYKSEFETVKPTEKTVEKVEVNEDLLDD